MITALVLALLVVLHLLATQSAAEHADHVASATRLMIPPVGLGFVIVAAIQLLNLVASNG